MKKKNKLPISIVIPTLGYKHLIKCLEKINLSLFLPNEVLIVVPKENFENLFDFKSYFPKLNIRIIISRKKNQVHQRILGFKKVKNKYVMQLDDDVILHAHCLHKLYNFIKKGKNTAIAPKYNDNYKLSKIYQRPKNLFLKFYHWLINSSKGFDPGKISLSGFNYTEESSAQEFKYHEWLSGGAIMHNKKNLILKNYYPFNFHRSFCEDILHSLLLRKKKIRLIKYYRAKVSAKKSGNITENLDKLKILKDLYSEFLIRKYIVEKFKLSKLRLLIYYFIYLIRILIRMYR